MRGQGGVEERWRVGQAAAAGRDIAGSVTGNSEVWADEGSVCVAMMSCSMQGVCSTALAHNECRPRPAGIACSVQCAQAEETICMLPAAIPHMQRKCVTQF
jgi:hypothetical protein